MCRLGTCAFARFVVIDSCINTFATVRLDGTLLAGGLRMPSLVAACGRRHVEAFMHRHCSYARPRRCTWLQGLAHSFSVLVFLTLSAPLAHAQTIGTIGLTPGWATFGQAVPQGAAPSGLQVGALLTQTDVKTRWPDGSIRFAVVTVNALTAGNYPITPAPIASGAFTPAVPAASVALSIGAVTYTA